MTTSTRPKVDKEMLDLAIRMIDRKKGKFDPSKLEDRYEKAVIELIKSKKKGGRKAPAREAEDRPSNVINLFDALKKSLASRRERQQARSARSRGSRLRRKLPARAKKACPRQGNRRPGRRLRQAGRSGLAHGQP